MPHTTPKPKQKRVLELGGGRESPVLKRLKKKVEAGKLRLWYHDIDTDHSNIHIKNNPSRLRIRLTSGTIHSFPYRFPNGRQIPNSSMNELHMHMPSYTQIIPENFKKFLDEVNRILKPGGRAYFTTDAGGLTDAFDRKREFELIQNDPRFRVRSYWDYKHGETTKPRRAAAHGHRLAERMSNYFWDYGRMFIFIEKRKDTKRN